MAVDTRVKRFSMMNLGDVWQPAIPTPDGSFSQGDRQYLIWGYQGNDWEVIVGIAGKMCITITSSAPSISFASSGPSAEITATTPKVTISDGGNCS